MASRGTDLLILGSGPAGLTAAIYAARAGLAPVVVAGSEPGGQLTLTTGVENFPGFDDAVEGPALMARMRRQAERAGACVAQDRIVAVDLTRRPFRLTGEADRFVAETLVIATGATARWLGLDSETALRGKGVSACATCDGVLFKGKPVAVIGGGSTAVEEALYLTHHASSVTLIHRRDRLSADRMLQDRLRAHEGIDVRWNSRVRAFIGDEDGLTALELEDAKGGIERLAVEGAFVAIGYDPATALFGDQLDLDDQGYVVVAPGSTRTSVAGVFACGDVADRVYRQAVTAAGTGCMAALDAERFLAERG